MPTLKGALLLQLLLTVYSVQNGAPAGSGHQAAIRLHCFLSQTPNLPTNWCSLICLRSNTNKSAMRQVPLCTLTTTKNTRASTGAMMLKPTWLQQPQIFCQRFSLPALVLPKAEPGNHDQNLRKQTVHGRTSELSKCLKAANHAGP